MIVLLTPSADTKFPGEANQQGRNINEMEKKVGDFRRKSPFTLEMVRDRPMVTMEH